MIEIEVLGDEVLKGKQITKQEALELYQMPLEPLCKKADEIRQHYCGNIFDLCAIINGKSGKCSENCRFCAQSAYSRTDAAEYPLLSKEEILTQAKQNDSQGVLRYSIVTSGKRLSEEEISQMCETIRVIREETGISVCVSFGLLTEEQFRKLKEAGAERAHNNLEASRNFFPNVCTTHTFEDKIATAQAAKDLRIIKGLGDEVVRPQLEHVHPVRHPHLGGGHDDGHGLAPADTGNELFPCHAGKHQVQYNQVIVVFLRPQQGLAAGKGRAAGVTGALQNRAQQAVDVGVVLHH